jgi:hypothetical protein
VVIVQASPVPGPRPGGSPIIAAPVMRRYTGRSADAPRTSESWQTYPSIAEREKWGTGFGARTSSAATRPAAACTGMRSPGNGVVEHSHCSNASSNRGTSLTALVRLCGQAHLRRISHLLFSLTHGGVK